MNWLLIIVISVLAFSMLRGYRRGLLRMLYSLVSWIVMFFLVSQATPYVNTFLKENTMLYERIAQSCESAIREKAQNSIEENAQNIAEQQVGEVQNLGMQLPEAVMSELAEKTADAAGGLMESAGVYEQLAYGLADFILNGISFFATMAVAMLLLHSLSRIVGIVSRIPVIRGVNRYLGMVVGVVFGLAVIWIGFYLIALCGTSETGNMLISYIYESPFLTYLYENNLIITVVLLCLQ